MIVRVSGLGQFELGDEATHRLEALDIELTAALHASEESEFHRLLHQTIEFVRNTGTEVPHERVVPSQVVIPPEDVTMQEAQSFFTNEDLLHPVQA